MLMKFASRVDKLPITGIRYMHNLAMKYPDAIDLSIGQPDFTPFSNIRKIASDKRPNDLLNPNLMPHK